MPELLHRYGVNNVNGIPWRRPPLVHDDVGRESSRSGIGCVERGADPDLAWGVDGEVFAARRCCSTMDVRWSTGWRHGGDVSRRRATADATHTGRAVRNADIASWLPRMAAKNELLRARSLCCCLRARRSRGRSSHAAARPSPERSWAQSTRDAPPPSESGNAAVLETMLACGF
jgi:hypothetical protein